MPRTDQSDTVIGVFAIGALAVCFLWRIIVWIKRCPIQPDPWDAETEQAVQREDAVPVCHRCLTRVPTCQWFCETCGSAVGPYNNYMPYLRAFSEGEMFRNGTQDHLRFNALVVIGYLLYSINMLIFAPVFWFFLFRNLRRSRAEESNEPSELGVN